MTAESSDQTTSGQIASLATFEIPDLEMIAKRRLQLWVMTLSLLVISVALFALVLFSDRVMVPIASPPILVYAGVVLLVVIFSFYAIWRELQLRKMTEDLVDERVLASALANSLREANLLMESGKNFNIRRDLDQVFETILSCSLDLLDGKSGSIMLMYSDTELRTVCSKGLSTAAGARVSINEGIAGQVAATREPVLIHGVFDWRHYHEDEEDSRATSALSIPLTKGDDIVGVLNVNAKANRRYTDRDLRAMSLFGGQAGAVIENIRVYEAERQAFEQKGYHALHDPLTGLPNKSLLLDRARSSLARRRPPGNAVVLLFLNLDDFKRVNDSLGHSAGDQVLIALADRLRQSVRAGDSVAHFGGDEFAILLEAKDAEEAQGAAGRILRDLAKPFPLEEGREVRFTATVGIAMEYSSSARAEDLVRNAFTALHTAKERGKGQVAIFEASMHSTALYRLDLEHDLRNAVEQKKLDVFFQPLMDLSDLSVHGFEALVRWNHPKRGLVAACSFVPLAEEAGLQPQIDRMVLQQTCLRVKELNNGMFADHPAAAHVNLSPKTIREKDFVTNLARDLEESGLDPAQLVLEITESVMMDDVELAARKLRTIKSLGVRLALDDFGTGYSSLSYLRSFPVDVVKIDKIFVDEIEKDKGAAALVQAILRLGLGLTFDVVAEGIETEEQMNSLLDLGCRYGQGYFLAHPLSQPDLADFLKRVGQVS